MIKVMATLIAKNDTVEEAKAALSSLVQPTRAEEGCIAYALYQSDTDPTEFVTIEEWTDQAALDAHMSSEHIQAALGSADQILAAEPKIVTYSKIV